ncbi:hypothetical protein MAPG_04933 [Magnaporthiopsis poae ATCC 64411]|uniref:Uncharacterized protein n=1 Tax=Magnaporthiopsis poae (strain ATCC 64411 / 73-15) TaxID=644358 RepID=A0A0C4DY24_MAGP6|nr:hypothetical protein MAPG_04933 [Magnaporthiopsis poae ATCC 64411]
MQFKASCSHIRENIGLFFTITDISNWNTDDAEQALRASLGQQCGVSPGSWMWEQQLDGSAIVTFVTPTSTPVLCVSDCIRWAGGPYSTSPGV